jgi:uncharacterized protein (PEP-CTERM system associated)
MHECPPRAASVRGRIPGALLCATLAALGRGALAQEVPAGGGIPGVGAGPATGGIGGVGLPELGTAGPVSAAPSVLPATGVGAGAPDVRLGYLGVPLAPAGGVPVQPTAGPAWTFRPQIALAEEYQSSGGVGGSSGAQYITSVAPSLFVTGDSSRLHAEVNYAPQVQFYQPDGSQNQTAQNFNGRLLATLVPQTLFLDLRGSGSVSSIAAGQAPVGVTNEIPANTSQNYTFSASPYALHRFGDWGTAELGGTLARITQNALETANPAAPVQASLASLAAASNQNASSYGGHLAFTTGEAFGRYNGVALLQTTDIDGTGVLSGAYRDIASLDSGYALTRNIIALATVGYERIHYAGDSPVRIDDAIWNAGVRLTPNADSSITVRYGHQDGLNSLMVDAGYQATARTRFFARYSEGLATGAELLQNALATSDLDALGNPVDHATGAPLVSIGNFFGTQNSLFRTTTASLTGVLTLDRDIVTLGFNSQDQKLVSASSAEGETFGGTRGAYGSLSWSHLLQPDLQGTLYGQYGVASGGGLSGNEQLAVLSATLSYALSATLSGTLQYSYNRTFGGGVTSASTTGETAATTADQSLVLISLIKSF